MFSRTMYCAAMVVVALLALRSPSQCQAPTPPAATSAPTATAPPTPVGPIRNKISAGDLLSAESILELHRSKNGEDGNWLVGLSWLARGAFLLGDLPKAELYAKQTLASCDERMAKGAKLDADHDLEYALGTAVELQAQLLERRKGTKSAVSYIRGRLAAVQGPVGLVARFNKRLNMLKMVGQPAPEIAIEDHIGDPPPPIAALRGKPVVMFIWAYGCGDCKGQEPALARVKKAYEGTDVQFYTLTRFYDPDSAREREKFLIDSTWKSVYADLGTVPMAISTASAEGYGGSSTPTFVFIDRKGIVRRYTPTRLTEDELRRTIDKLLH